MWEYTLTLQDTDGTIRYNAIECESATVISSIVIGYTKDNIICTEIIHNDDNCTSLYLSYLPYLRTYSRPPNIFNIEAKPIAIAFNFTPQMFPTRQTLVFCNGEYARISSSWLFYTHRYDNISDALKKLNMGLDLAVLSPIKQGYLIYLLLLHRRGNIVAPLYNLEEPWNKLLASELLLQSADMVGQIKLLEMGFRSYLDVNKYILISLETNNWELLRYIVRCYHKTFDFRPYRALIDESVPPDIATSFLSAKSKMNLSMNIHV